MKQFLRLFVILIALTISLNVANAQVHIPEPVPPPPAVRAIFDLSPFYQQWIGVDGLPILASTQVSPYAVKEVAWLIYNISRHRPDVIEVMVGNKVRFSIIGHTERTTDIPEHSILTGPFVDLQRGGRYCPICKTMSTTEENVLDEQVHSVTIHEFAHAFHEAGLNMIDPTFDDRLRRTYTAAMARGLWQNTYASTNFSEYWAEGVATWFDANSRFPSVTTRAALKTYDPGLALLLTETFGDGIWRYTLPATRTDLPHLRGFNPQTAPRWQRPPELLDTYREFTSNPDNTGGGKWVNLKSYEPSQLQSLNRQRTRGTSWTFAHFMNHTDATVQVYRVNSDGKEVYARNFTPLSFREIDAYNTGEIDISIGELLLVKDDTGKNIAVFFVDKITPGSIVRIFVGNPEPMPITDPEIAVEAPPVVKVPTTGTDLAIDKPPALTRDNFTIAPGEFSILVHDGHQAILKQAHFKTYDAYWGIGNNSRDIPNLSQFFQDGGRIELVSFSYDHAQFGDIVISEIMWGLDDTSPAKQYIELYNASAHTYTFVDANLSLRFSTASQESLPDASFPAPDNPDVRLKVLDRVSNKGWKVPGKSGNLSENEPLISMYRTIDYTIGDVPDGTLASSWKASSGRVNLPAPSFGTPGAKHLPPAPVVYVEASQRPPMYWVDAKAGTLHRLVGDEVENFLPNVQNATSLAVDVAGRKLYWTEKTGDRTGRIRGANLDGTHVKLVKDLTSVPHSIALDTVNGKLYLTNAWGKVQRLDIDGSNFQPNFITNLNAPKHITVDVADSKVYWTEMEQQDGRIQRANLDGSSVQNVATGLAEPTSLAVAGGKIYWTERTTENAGKLQHANLDGTNSEVLETLSIAPTSIAVDPVPNSLYLTLPSGEIHRRNLDGSGDQSIVTNLGSPGSIVLGILATDPVPTDTPIPPAEPVVDTAADVNQDQKINKTDLLLVVTALGESPPANANFDVNADGTINIADVLLVIEALDDPVAAAAPSFGETRTALDPGRLAMQIDILRAESDGSLKYEHAIAFFQSLLASIHPTETQLLANYPNPFNPETWIPYQLSENADVKISIHAVNGKLVRTLDLGHQTAGIYESQSRAAYWDGRNALGEPVASGLYFYTLTAGDFTATRRMLILK